MVRVCRCPQRPEQGVRSPETAITGSYESVNVGAGNPTQVWRDLCAFHLRAISAVAPASFIMVARAGPVPPKAEIGRSQSQDLSGLQNDFKASLGNFHLKNGQVWWYMS